MTELTQFCRMASRTKQKYPVSVPELSEAEIKLLIDALHTDTPQSIFTRNAKTYDEHTHGAIRSLPTSLRAKHGVRLIPTPAFFSSAALCNVHKGLNKYIISQIVRMIKREVGGHLDKLTHYPRIPLDPDLGDALCTLRSVAGMWYTPSSSGESNRPKNFAPYQTNKCEACMIVRILMDQKCVRYLCATVHSRVRTTYNYRVPKLRRVIDAIMKTYDEKTPGQNITPSTNLVWALKRARKEAFREKHRHLHGGCKDKHGQLSQRRTRPLDHAGRPDGQTLSSLTVEFCMIQESDTGEEEISPQEEKDQNPQDHSQPIHSVKEESMNHKLRLSLSDAMFMSPEEAVFANDSGNEEEERQQHTLFEIINCYMGLRTPRTSITSLVSLENTAALDEAYMISPLSPQKNKVPLPRIEEKGRNNEYDPTNGASRLGPGPPPKDLDWDSILQRGKQGSTMDKLISQIGDLLDEQARFRSRTASQQAESYIAIIPELDGLHCTDENGEAIREPSGSNHRDTTWSFLLREC
ncbi:hypothetical protein BJX63DRAFT_4338 [Aspergillus granulosus]|uniref:Uncharacterized protein n=1 Tax=Aspergillus granulosus TaxID=176169 RepID=A0ABR4I5M7_9EURO